MNQPIVLPFVYPGDSARKDNNEPLEITGNVPVFQTSALRSVVSEITSTHLIIYSKPEMPVLGAHALNRLMQVALDTEAALLYCNYQEILDGIRKNHPLNDYQTGSVRDDFDFGPLWLVRTRDAQAVLNESKDDFESAGLYDLRLGLSRRGPVVHLDENLYTVEEHDLRSSDEKMFAYVDPKNRSVQMEMEAACTKHLKVVGAWLPPVFEQVDLSQGEFPVEASVIIPVRNRIRTIADAVRSVLSQEAPFAFNLIVVDNHSTDGTTEELAKLAAVDNRLIHVQPDRDDLGIGGCWNVGVHHPSCGRFAVQLDSDDVYSGPDTLARIVAAFYEQGCTMLVGTYRMCNVELETIPPGIIDHREWTEENGRNNALRINGLGAPRAFFTPLLRTINVPNTSYGEDYALGLRFSRTWKIGRIYDVLYLCRRWEDNSDASIDLVRLNANNAYKDKLRSIEIAARQKQNANKAL